MHRTSAFRIIALVLAFGLLATACGDDSSDAPAVSGDATADTEPSPDTDATDAAGIFPLTLESGSESITIDARPERIVSLSATATEILFAIGAGDQVVAVDDQSDFPADVPTTDLSGFTPNVEAIAEFDPDLVVASYDPGELVAGLDALGIPTLIHGAAPTIDDAYTQMEQLGAATGHVAEAAELVGSISTDLDELVTSAGDTLEGLTYYYELDPTYYTATSNSFVGSLFDRVGLVNIGDAADDGSGYPQLSVEFIVSEDPDLIILADTECCDQSAETVAERAGWADLGAVTGGNVIELDDDIASRWGPRVVELMDTVVARANQAAGANS